jgi:hypothetical protein
VGWGVPTGRRQTTVALPANAVACFFTDGLVEARAGGRMLGRERLTRELSDLGPVPTAQTLLERLIKAADESSDDMAACVVRAGRGVPGAPVRVEELVLDLEELDGATGGRFLAACGVAEDDIAPALASARHLAHDCDGAIIYVRIDTEGASVKAAGVASEAANGRPLNVLEPDASLAAS